MKTRCLSLILLFLLPLSVHAQSIILGTVCDAFLKTPLPAAKVSLLTPDSTVVMDSIPMQISRDSYGNVKKTNFILRPNGMAGKFLLHATCKGYTDAWAPLNVNGEDKGISGLDDPLELRKTNEAALDEVTVTATKLKMFYRGDTLIYDASAFKLPDGSMLDDLIRQLPGVTMNDAGEIFVNGRKVEELLLGARSFFGSNRKILLENLPYYTVKHIKVYEMETDASRAMGWEVQSKRFVMDVDLKDEYKNGYMGNLEAAYGTRERRLGRGFLLGFTDRLRFTLLANGNNVNEKRHIGSSDNWSPDRFPRSLQTTYSVAGEVDYQSDDKNTKNNVTFDFTSSKEKAEMRQHRELFLNGSTPFSTVQSSSNSGESQWNIKEKFSYIKPRVFMGDFSASFAYKTYNGRTYSRSEEFNDTLTTRVTSGGFNEGRSLALNLGAYNWIRLKGRQVLIMDYSLSHLDEKNETARRYRTEQFAGSADYLLHNSTDYSNRSTMGYIYFIYEGTYKDRLRLRIEEQPSFSIVRTRDWLYHPDTLILPSAMDALKAVTDPRNSYVNNTNKFYHVPRVALTKLKKMGTEALETYGVRLQNMTTYDRLDYQRGAVDTLARRTSLSWSSSVFYNYYHKERKSEKLVLDAGYRTSYPYLLNLINFVDDAMPQVVKLGNPDLKGASSLHVSADYSDSHSRHRGQQFHICASFNYHLRDEAQSVTYNPESGVYTYKPMNVKGGYTADGHFDFMRPIDEKQCWTWQSNSDANFHHSVDYAMLAGETESRVNAVNTLTLREGAWIQYHKDDLNVRLTGDFRWRHSEGRMRDFTTLDAFDYQYGVTARYTIPVVKLSISLDAGMYSRRGYGSSAFDTDNFVVNAQLGRSFLKSKLIARIEAFDLFHQLSSTQYEVNAQGRTETWQRTLPNYVMLHVIYHFNKNPKR